VSVILSDLGAELLQSLNVKIDRPGSDGAAAGERDAGAAAAGNQWPQDERRCAHLFHQFIRGFGAGQSASADGGAMLSATVSQFDFSAHGSQEFARSFDIAHLWNIFQNDWLVGQQGGGHSGQGSVLGAADADCSQQRIAPSDYKLVHSETVLIVRSTNASASCSCL